VRVDGPLVFNDADLIQLAALDGLGIAYLFEEHVRVELADGRLVRVLENWCPPEPGFYVYYPGRR
jgi:DNA-binding transcriptional LysR family regulator